jgi:predicted dienelactone hydrolase
MSHRARTPSDRSSQPNVRRRRLTAVLALLVPAVVIAVMTLSTGGGTSAGSRPGQTSTTTSRQSTTTPHKQAVARRPAPRITGVAKLTLTLNEPSTASVATGQSGSGQPVRVLPTVVRYPIVSNRPAGLRFPLVVFSQGFDEPAEAYSGLMDAWTRAGYVVAAPTYPRTDPSSPGGVNESDIVNHPADLRFVISALQSAGRSPASPLHGVLNPGEVGIAGQSDGGDVGLAVAADSCCRDAVVKAAVILSGAELAAFGGTYFTSHPSVPLLVTQGSSDTINVPGCSVQLYDQASPPKYYLDILGAEHLPPYVDPGPTRSGIALVTIAFLNRFLKHRPGSLARVHSQLPQGETLTSAPMAPAASEGCPGAP